MAAVDKVRIVLAGDSGVGKTSLAHLIATRLPLESPGWTIGCSVEVTLHEYKEGTPNQKSFFIELFDVGGSINHKNTRNVFYNPVHGIILVHDLTNRKSHVNLYAWLTEIINKDGKDVYKNGNSNVLVDFDSEHLMGTIQIPILVIGTKLDLVGDKYRKQTTGSIADMCGAEEIFLNNHNVKSLSAGTSDAVKLGHFFDKVIERKYYSKDTGFYSEKNRKITQY